VAFSSRATNLVSGDTNEKSDVFVHDRETGGTVLASQAMAGMVGNDGSDYAVMSGNGRFVAFYSYATDLIDGDTNEQVDVFLYEVEEITIPTPTFTIYLPMIRK
jgi:hypothetical protein